jgi:hypothetical protein
MLALSNSTCFDKELKDALLSLSDSAYFDCNDMRLEVPFHTKRPTERPRVLHIKPNYAATSAITDANVCDLNFLKDHIPGCQVLTVRADNLSYEQSLVALDNADVVILGGGEGSQLGLTTMEGTFPELLRYFVYSGGHVVFLHESLSRLGAWNYFPTKLAMVAAAVPLYPKRFDHAILTEKGKLLLGYSQADLPAIMEVSRTHQCASFMPRSSAAILATCDKGGCPWLIASADHRILYTEIGHYAAGTTTAHERRFLSALVAALTSEALDLATRPITTVTAH